MGTFLIDNMTFGLRFGFQRHAFPNKRSFFKVLFFFSFCFLLKKMTTPIFIKTSFSLKRESLY